MVWYNAGTVTVTNGSPVVTASAGVDFISNVNARDGFALTGGSLNEIASIDSKAQLTLARPWLGATAGGQGYTIIPTTGFPVDLALSAIAMLASYAALRDGIGQGLIPAGTLAAPGLRFAADQDTGFYRSAENQLALVTGGVVRATFDGAGVTSPGLTLTGAEFPALALLRNGIGTWFAGGAGIAGVNNFTVRFNAAAAFIAVDTGGNVGVGTAAPVKRLDVQTNSDRDGLRLGLNAAPTAANGAALTFSSYTNTAILSDMAQVQGVCTNGGASYAGDIVLRTAAAGALSERARLTGDGNLLVGVSAASNHTLTKSGLAEGGLILQADGGAGSAVSLQVRRVNASAYNGGANAALMIGNNTTNGRSISASGTINASGADYAEYMTKAPGCCLIAKGDACGVDNEGRLTRSWADAILFKVKSTDPNVVGGDTYSANLGERPAVPLLALPVYDGLPEPVTPTEPVAPQPATDRPVEPTREDGEEDIDFIRRMAAFLVDDASWIANQEASTGYTLAKQVYEAAMATYAAELPVYAAAKAAYDAAVTEAEAAHDAALAQYEIDLAAFEDAVETARLGVDRIAYCGRVPVNFADPCQPGDYLVAIANGGGIGLKAVAEADITFADYRRRVGRVLTIGADGRPIVDVAQG